MEGKRQQTMMRKKVFKSEQMFDFGCIQKYRSIASNACTARVLQRRPARTDHPALCTFVLIIWPLMFNGPVAKR
jgi:hypothetical protein